MLSRVCVAVSVIAVVAVAAAGAAPTPVTPKAGATMTTTHPRFAWTLPSGESAQWISVATSPTINPETLDFMPVELIQAGVLTSNTTTWTPDLPLPADTYYWHVAGRTETVSDLYSPVSSFVIRPLISKLSIAVKTRKVQRMFSITTSWVANEPKVAFTARLSAGSKKLAERKLNTENDFIDERKQALSTWIVPARVKKGARLRFVVTLRSEGGAKATKAIALRAP